MLTSGDGKAREGSPAANGLQRAVPLLAPVTVIGRGQDADLRLSDPGVSRHHAQVELRDGDVWLEDLGSTNGTTVDGAPVTSPTDAHQRSAHRHRLQRAGLPARPRRLVVQGSTVPDLAIFGIRVGLLALLWLFVLAAVRVMRNDLTGTGPVRAAGRAARGPRRQADPAQGGETGQGQRRSRASWWSPTAG